MYKRFIRTAKNQAKKGWNKTQEPDAVALVNIFAARSYSSTLNRSIYSSANL